MKTADYRSLADFRHQIRRFLNFSERAAREAGLKPQHHQLLLALKGAPPGAETTVSYLAERLQLRHHTLVELIDRLQARRLVRRVRSPRDRRAVLVSITSRGERILLKLSLHHQEVLRRLGPALVRSLRRVSASAARSGAPRLAREAAVARSGSSRRAKRA